MIDSIWYIMADSLQQLQFLISVWNGIIGLLGMDYRKNFKYWDMYV